MPGLAFYDLFSHKLSNIVIVKKICNALSGCSAYLNISQSFQKRFWIQIYSFNAPMVGCHITIRLNQYGDTASLIPDHIIVFEGKKENRSYHFIYHLIDISIIFVTFYLIFYAPFGVGLYYHLPKRAAGIRYVFIGKPMNQRPR